MQKNMQIIKKDQLLQLILGKYWRRHPDLNRRITVLQTVALPLGYAAGQCSL